MQEKKGTDIHTQRYCYRKPSVHPQAEVRHIGSIFGLMFHSDGGLRAVAPVSIGQMSPPFIPYKSPSFLSFLLRSLSDAPLSLTHPPMLEYSGQNLKIALRLSFHRGVLTVVCDFIMECCDYAVNHSTQSSTQLLQ